MPLKLRPPRPPKHPNYAIRGTYLGIFVERSAGTPDGKVARAALAKIKRDIECGVFAGEQPKTLADAAVSYMQAGGERRFVAPLIEHMGKRPLSDIDQAAIDAAAVALYPDATPATRNRQVYSPVSAILRHAGTKLQLHRPKGGQGKRRKSFLTVEQAFAFLAGAEAADARFGVLCTFLLYTGSRLGEALSLSWEDVDLGRSIAYVRMTKNGEPRTVFLPEPVVTAFANLGNGSGRIFPWSKGGKLNDKFHVAAKAAGIVLEERVAFHVLRHTYGAWMRRHAGLDTSGLVATGAWKSHTAARVYEHVDVPEAAKAAALLPVRTRK